VFFFVLFSRFPEIVKLFVSTGKTIFVYVLFLFFIDLLIFSVPRQFPRYSVSVFYCRSPADASVKCRPTEWYCLLQQFGFVL